MKLPRLTGRLEDYIPNREAGLRGTPLIERNEREFLLDFRSLLLHLMPSFLVLNELRKEATRRESGIVYDTSPSVDEAFDFIKREYLLRAGMSHNLLRRVYDQINDGCEQVTAEMIEGLLEDGVLRRFVSDWKTREGEKRHYEVIEDMGRYDPLFFQVMVKKAKAYNILRLTDGFNLVKKPRFIKEVEYATISAPITVVRIIMKKEKDNRLLGGIVDPFS